ncbi:MAG: flavin reductase family protein [Chloroflexi bacterium]|nr:flavin reductase family protein [Chloroflexota bacterium]MBU1746249.1 flavin reductase family protein [Chloroflexota bacterium]
MVKRRERPFPALYPTPAVLVSCVDEAGVPNVVTVAWIGTVSSTPPQVSIALRPSRASHDMIRDTGEFVVNMPTARLLDAVDRCGRLSGDDIAKFAATGLTPAKAAEVRAPLVAECPVNLECRVTETTTIGSHTLFVGEVVAVHIDDAVRDEAGFIDYDKARPIVYMGNEYWSLGERLQVAGYTAAG